MKAHTCGLAGFARFALVVILSFAATSIASAQTAVTTYHNDNYRTGWNSTETVLTPSNVSNSTFGLLATVPLDDQIDAVPLIVPGVNITAGGSQGTHDVVYIASGNNTVYAIDANSGAVLLTTNLGKPVFAPLGCNNNGPHVGVDSTPVIDVSANTMYVIAYTQDKSGPTYRLHALDLGNLTDKLTPALVSASHTLSNGTTFNFNATYQRQRPALLELGGNIYAGFGSFCDQGANLSRGWLLAWTAATLAPFPTNQLNDTQSSSPDSFFLSSIWMSGYGLATDISGNILFVTGNSDYSGNTYDGITNLQESVVKVNSSLTDVLDIFTPSNQASLDQGDVDFGSGGVLVLPPQSGATPHLAVAAGKYGSMYFMNEDNLGGYSTSGNNVLGTYPVGGCWCGESYYVGIDGVVRIVSSGGDQVMVWKLQNSPTTKLTRASQSPALASGQDGGFFTTVSSNSTTNPIIWALTRPLSRSNNAATLYAINPGTGTSMKLLFHSSAGSWPNVTGNLNQVPVVANGKVYVATNKQLQIFGLKNSGTKAGKK
jgi:PQQ enzyme repeat